MSEIQETAQKVMSRGKGILASDERPSSANKNLIKAGIILPKTPNKQEELRRKYRELFINTDGIEEYVSAMILCDETFWQLDSSGKSFREILRSKGIEIVIKVDGGTTEMPGFTGEKITLGLDELEKDLPMYYENGARLAKWRSVFLIGEDTPSDEIMETNLVGLSTYALFCQKNNIVPIVEPEVLIDGNHTIEQAKKVNIEMLSKLFENLKEFKVDLSGLILKTSMVIPGKESTQKVSHKDIAKATVTALKKSVPKGVGGVVFLSGGQTSQNAIDNLNEISKLEPLPWEIAFSYLRAIEGPATKEWGGLEENVDKARKVFLERLQSLKKADSGSLD